MEHMRNLSSHLLTEHKSSNDDLEKTKKSTLRNPENPVSPQDMDDLFIFMIDRYGNAWSHGCVDKNGSWFEALLGLKHADLRRGCESLKTTETEFLKFPPNQFEFKKLCQQKKPAEKNIDLDGAYKEFLDGRIDKLVKTYQEKIAVQLRCAILNSVNDPDTAEKYIYSIYKTLKEEIVKN